jgi:hypothetical protein
VPQRHRATLGCDAAAYSLLSPEIPKTYGRLLLSGLVFAGVPFPGGVIIASGQRLMRAAPVWVTECPMLVNEDGEPVTLLAYRRYHQGRSYLPRSTIPANEGYSMSPRHHGRGWLLLTGWH